MELKNLCSNAEGLPNSILEAMYAGLPVVGTDIPGIKEAVGEENFKYLAPPEDFQTLSEKIILFYENNSLRKLVGDKNKERVLKEFPLIKMCKDTNQIMLNVIKDFK